MLFHKKTTTGICIEGNSSFRRNNSLTPQYQQKAFYLQLPMVQDHKNKSHLWQKKGTADCLRAVEARAGIPRERTAGDNHS